MGRSIHFHSKRFRQNLPQHEIHHSELPSYFKYFYCQWAQICVQQRHQHYFHLETDTPMLGLRLKGTSSGRARDQRPWITEEAAIWSWSSRGKWWAGSGLAASPLVQLQPNHCALQTTRYPIKWGNDEYQMCNCGSLWTQVENLQFWKPTCSFSQELYDHIS